MTDPLIDAGVRDHVGTLTLLSPTMPPTFFAELEAAVGELAGDPDVRAIVVQSSAKAFSYGLDLAKAFAELGPLLTGGGLAGEREELRRLILRLQGSMTAVADCPIPVIAAVHGRCIGGGLDLATACDIRLASAESSFSLRETKIAIVADLGSLQRLPRIVGSGNARELAFTGKDIDAERARSIGLVNEIYSDREAVQRAALELAAEIAANSPLTVRGVKRVLDYSQDHTVAEGLDYVANWNSAFLGSADLAEAFAAFMAKRAPEFTGR